MSEELCQPRRVNVGGISKGRIGLGGIQML